MKTELKQEILSALNERIEAIVGGKPGGVFFAEEAIELARAEMAAERILNIPHREQCLVKRYLQGFMDRLPESFTHKVDLLMVRMLSLDATLFFHYLNYSIDKAAEGWWLNGDYSNWGSDDLVDRAIRDAGALTEAVVDAAALREEKPDEDEDPLDFDSGIPF